MLQVVTVFSLRKVTSVITLTTKIPLDGFKRLYGAAFNNFNSFDMKVITGSHGRIYWVTEGQSGKRHKFSHPRYDDK